MRKPLVSLALFVASWSALALLANPVTATIILALISVHEAGHLLMMRRFGIPLQGLYFIPLLGAVIVPGERIRTREAGVAVALGGPLAGLVSTVAALGVYAAWPGPTAAAAAFVAALINFLNMLPVYPLDGGQALACALDDGTRTHERLAKLLRIAFFAGIAAIVLAFDAWLLGALVAYFGSRGLKAFLIEVARREDRRRVALALAKTFATQPERALDAAEAPLQKLEAAEEPKFPEALLREHRGLYVAEGLRRIEWCVPEDADIDDAAAEIWGAELDAVIERNAALSYERAVADIAHRAVGSYRISLFGGPERVTGRANLYPDPAASSGLRTFLTEDLTPPLAVGFRRRALGAYAALGLALAACAAWAGYHADWSIKALL